MVVTNLIKNIIAESFSVVGFVLNKISGFFQGLATVFYSLSVSLHMVLNTEEGVKLKELERSTQKIINTYNTYLNKVETYKKNVAAEENKLAKVLKEDKNVIKLGKNTNDDTKS